MELGKLGQVGAYGRLTTAPFLWPRSLLQSVQEALEER